MPRASLRPDAGGSIARASLIARRASCWRGGVDVCGKPFLIRIVNGKDPNVLVRGDLLWVGAGLRSGQTSSSTYLHYLWRRVLL
jgi:hypothetical protein